MDSGFRRNDGCVSRPAVPKDRSGIGVFAVKPTTERKRSLGSDLAKLDAHEITPEEYDDIPELTDEWFEQADLYEGGKLIRRGKRDTTKE
jgi:hypothetical protein